MMLPFLSSLLPCESPEDSSCVQEGRWEKCHVNERVQTVLFLLCGFSLSLSLSVFFPAFEVRLLLLSDQTKALLRRKDLPVFHVSSAFKGAICV